LFVIGNFLFNLGQLVLENVPIKRKALRRFNLPVYISSGIVGKLTVSIPITRLHVEPWVISISDVSVVIESSHLEYDVEFDEQYAQFKKNEQMNALEIIHRKHIYQSFSYDNSWWNYGTSLALRIMENVHLVASNISVVYRDRSTAADHPFTLGISISELTMQNSDKNWVRGYNVRRPDENMFKIIDLVGFSVYWDSGCSEDENIVNALAQLVFGHERSLEHEYILHPLAMTVHIQKRASVWWRFAIEHCCDDWKLRRSRLRPAYVANRAHHFTSYCKAYSQKLLNKGFTKSDEVLMRQIEHEYSLDDLYLFREVAVEYLVRPFVPDVQASPSTVSPIAQQQSWLRSWIDWFTATGTYNSELVTIAAEKKEAGSKGDQDTNDDEQVLSSAEKLQLEKMLAENVLDIMDEITCCHEAEVFAELHVSVANLALSTCDDSIYPETSPWNKRSVRTSAMNNKHRSVISDTSVEVTSQVVFQPVENSDSVSYKYDVRVSFDKQVTVGLDQREYLSLKRLFFAHEDRRPSDAGETGSDKISEVSGTKLQPSLDSQLVLNVDMTAVCLNLRTLFAGVEEQQLSVKQIMVVDELEGVDIAVAEKLTVRNSGLIPLKTTPGAVQIFYMDRINSCSCCMSFLTKSSHSIGGVPGGSLPSGFAFSICFARRQLSIY
uniref:Fmp27_GFWDK domain-containing protein n=1 Tax=Soboliphyme baturini TaxID=241478 RepID=A0A183IQC0_9BILA